MIDKKIIATLILLVYSAVSFAQYRINSEFSNGNMDNNLSIMIEKKQNRNYYSLGLKVHLKTPYLDDGQGYIFYRNSYATSLSDFIGVKANYERQLTSTKWKNFSLTSFGNTYFFRLRAKLIESQGSDSFFIFKRTNFLENHIGLGLRVKIVEPLYLMFKAGGGVMLVWVIDNQTLLINGGRRWTWQFSRLFSIGIGVKL